MRGLTALAERARPNDYDRAAESHDRVLREACLSARAHYFFDKNDEFRLALETNGAIARNRRAGTT